MTGTQKIFADKKKILGNLIGSAVFISLACVVVYHRAELTGWQHLAVYIAYPSIVIFLWLFLYTAVTTLFPKPLLILDDHGLLDQSSIFSVGFIPWSDITRVYPTVVSKQRFLSVELKEPDRYLEKLTGWKHLMMKMNLQVGHAPIKIIQNMFSLTSQELGELMKPYMNK